MKRVELYEAIRRDRREGLSIRALADKHRVHRRTVREAVRSAVPADRKTPERDAPVLGPVKGIIDQILADDRRVPRKQRHTARRIHQRLVEEWQAEISESTVRLYVAERRRELAGGLNVVTVPQHHVPGEEAEADFGELYVYLAGVLTKVFMFALRLSASGKAFHRVYMTQAQEAFFDGLQRAFVLFEGCPHRVRFDNLKPAVTRVLKGRNREENERFIALRSHFGFDSFFCVPGIEGAHEKGGVEGEVGRFRRRHLVPIPRVETLAELNAAIEAVDAAEDARRIGTRPSSIGEDFAAEAACLLALPAEPFDTTRHLPVRVDTKARVCVRQCFYSVPARLAARRIEARLGAERVELVCAGAVVASHDRLVHRGDESLCLDHYLEVLCRKPGALPGASALVQARATGAFTDAHEAYWTAARRSLGDAGGTKALIEVLLLHRSLPASALVEALRSCVASGIVDPAAVTLEARRCAEDRPSVIVPIGALTRYDRPVPVLSGYDALLEQAVPS